MHTVKKTEAGPVASFKRLMQIARDGGYCCAVRSSQHSLSCLDLLAMRFGGVSRAIFRSSNTGTVSNSKKETLLHNLFKPLVRVAATDFAAPSTEAGVYMFGKAGVSGPRFHLMKNALNLEDYAYDASTRDDVKRELGVSAESYVVGTSGGSVSRRTTSSLSMFLLKSPGEGQTPSSFSSAKARHARPLRGALPSSD